MLPGYELGASPDGRGDGVFATRSFKAGDTVMVGEIDRRLPENHSHATQIGLSVYVLLAGLASKVNHSCNPNCGVRVNGAGVPDLVAMSNIAVGEEISFDYAMRNYSIDHFPSPCLCGADGCRRAITGWKDLPADRRAAYCGFVASYLLALDRARAEPEWPWASAGRDSNVSAAAQAPAGPSPDHRDGAVQPLSPSSRHAATP